MGGTMNVDNGRSRRSLYIRKTSESFIIIDIDAI
jgi:hypothetical protein